MLRKSFLINALLFVLALSAYAQTTSPNSDFESGDFTNWELTLATRDEFGNIIYPAFPPFNSGRIEIISENTLDKYTCGELPTIPPDGGNYTARIGNFESMRGVEILSYTIQVDQTNAMLLYRYAVLFENPDHIEHEQPFFQLRITDRNGDLIDPECGYIKIYSAENIPGFNRCEVWKSQAGNFGGRDTIVIWKPWTTVAVDLTPYMGQTINLEFVNADCGRRSHWAYSYIDVETKPLELEIFACEGDDLGTIEAPEGFTEYRWSTGETTRQIKISNPQDGQEFWCDMYTSQNCHVRLNGKLEIQSINVTPLDTTICEGSSATISASGADSYIWNNGQQGQTIEVSPSNTTQYIVTGSTESGCTQDAVVTVNVIQSPNLQINASPDEICIGESSTITVNGADTYKWENNVGSANTITVSPKATTTYTVTGEVAPGCQSTISQQVIVHPIPEINLGNDIEFCSENTEIYTINTDADSYKWNTGETTERTTVTKSGTYSLTITKNGCENTDEIEVKLGGEISVDLGEDIVLCNVESAEISPGNSYDTYKWNTWPTKKTPSITVTKSGEYSVTVTDGACVAIDTINVTLIPPISPVVSIKAEGKFICEPVPYTFSIAHKENEGSNPKYTWYVNDKFYKSGDESLTIDTLSQTTEIKLKLENEDECVVPSIVYDSIIVEINPPVIPELFIEATPMNVCEKTRTTFTVNTQNASIDAEYEWFLNGKPLGINAPRFNSDTISGNSELVVRVTSHHICMDQTVTDTIKILKNPKPVLQPVDLCLNDSWVKLSAKNLRETGGNYTVTSGNGVSKGGNSYVFYPEKAGVGSHTIEIEWTDENGCISRTDTTFNVYTIALPIVEQYLEDVVGEEPYKFFEAEGDEYLYWSDENGNFLQEGKIFHPDHECSKASCLHTYYVTHVLNPLGCRDSVEVTYYITNCVVPAPIPHNISICDYEDPPLLTADTAREWPANAEPGLSTLWWFNDKNAETDPIYAGMDGYQLKDWEEVYGSSIYVRQYNLSHNCISAPREVKVEIKKAFPPHVNGYRVCENELDNFEGKELKSYKDSETDLRWYINPHDKTPKYEGATYTPDAQKSTSIYVSQIENGCESDKTEVKLIIDPYPAPPILSPGEACEDERHKLNAQVNDDNVYLYWLSGTNEALGSEKTLYLENAILLMDQQTQFKAYVVNEYGCYSDTATTTYQMNSIPAKPIITGKDYICFGEEYGDLTSFVKLPYDQIEWYSVNDSVTILHQGETYSPTADTIGPYQYYAVVSNKGCKNKNSKSFWVRSLPNPVIKGKERVCVNTSNVTYVVTNPIKEKGPFYDWAISSKTKITTYDDTGQRGSAAIDFNTQGIDTLIVSIIDNYGCYGADTIAIRISELPMPDFSINQQFMSSKATFQNTSTESVIRDFEIEEELESNFIWDFDIDTSKYHQPFEDKWKDTTVTFPYGYHRVLLTAINEYGCIDTISKLIHGDVSQTLFIPNTVCPTHFNAYVSKFRPKGTGLETFDLWVYDKWGNIIWHTDKLIEGQPIEEWDCTYNEKLIQQGYYIWKAEATYKDGTIWKGQESKWGKTSKMGHIYIFY